MIVQYDDLFDKKVEQISEDLLSEHFCIDKKTAIKAARLVLLRASSIEEIHAAEKKLEELNKPTSLDKFFDWLF